MYRILSNAEGGLSGMPICGVQSLRLAPIRIIERWTSGLAHGSSAAIGYGLITAYIDPCSVAKNVPTLPQVQTDCRRQIRHNPRTAQNEFVMTSMGLAEFLENENSGQ
jgi:hypothetical protein